MKRMTCEMCSSNDIIKTGDFYECQACGTKYSVESARNLLVEIVDDSYEKELENCLALEKTEQFYKARTRYQELIERVPSRPEAYYYLIRLKSRQELNVTEDYRRLESLLADEAENSENRKMMKEVYEGVLNDKLREIQRDISLKKANNKTNLRTLCIFVGCAVLFIIPAVVQIFLSGENSDVGVIVCGSIALLFIILGFAGYSKYKNSTEQINKLNRDADEIENQKVQLKKELEDNT